MANPLSTKPDLQNDFTEANKTIPISANQNSSDKSFVNKGFVDNGLANNSIENKQFALDLITRFKNMTQHTASYRALNKSLQAYAKHEYATPLLVLRETLAGFVRHNLLSLAASLSFYALFALIPLIVLIFFLLSHWVFSSDYATVKLAILVGNLVPEFSNNIMLEVYSATQTKAAWGALGLIVLLWTVTPLAANMRSAFYTIAAMVEAPSYFKRKAKDVISVLGVLLIFFLFTSAGFVVETIVRFLATHLPVLELNIIGSVITLFLTILLVTVFYKLFFPIRVAFSHLFSGACLTVLLWLLMRPAFGLFLSINQNYGAIFGGMKAMFLSITWLYLNIAVFLLGCELINTLRKKDSLLFKGLFASAPIKGNYIETLMSRYGLALKQGDVIFERGHAERDLYYLVEGSVHLIAAGVILSRLNAGDYFGESALLTQKPSTSSAAVASTQARIIVIYAEHFDIMLSDNPKVAMQLLKQMAARDYPHAN